MGRERTREEVLKIEKGQRRKRPLLVLDRWQSNFLRFRYKRIFFLVY